MALNKFMHPRNLYKNPPDFSVLAKNFTEFSNIARVDVTGKVTINFKDSSSLRILTKCLLKSDFNLDVDIPTDRLVPTLPLRLNYILWLEDLMNAIKITQNIQGIDIGTGACAIYPLLAAVKNKWQMIGTETDKQSLLKAEENVTRNNLQHLIRVVENPTKTIVENILKSEKHVTFDFTMCNPPFYSNMEELCDSRSPARLPPKNGFTGSPQELITEGGELEFCRKFISESHKFRDRVLLYTTMVGHKCNLKELLQDLKAEGISNTSTEFCQGRVTRWGLAWTFQNYNISKLIPSRDKRRKKNIPITHLLPKLADCPHDTENVTKKMKTILQDLKINFKVLDKRGNSVSLNIKAMANTWSNQRRRKRMILRNNEDSKSKKIKLCCNSDDKKSNEAEKDNPSIITDNSMNTINSKDKDLVDNCNSIALNNQTETIYQSQGGAEDTQEPLVHAFIKMFKKGEDIILEMDFIGGSAGKEGLHQIGQNIKNNWK